MAGVDKYYLQNPRQQEIHEKLLNIIREDIKRLNEAIKEEKDLDSALNYSSSYLFEFTKQFAGEPLIYGMCLQKQHLDAIHYPFKLEIRNGYQPFLYR